MHPQMYTPNGEPCDVAQELDDDQILVIMKETGKLKVVPYVIDAEGTKNRDEGIAKTELCALCDKLYQVYIQTVNAAFATGAPLKNEHVERLREVK